MMTLGAHGKSPQYHAIKDVNWGQQSGTSNRRLRRRTSLRQGRHIYGPTGSGEEGQSRIHPTQQAEPRAPEEGKLAFSHDTCMYPKISF